MPGIFGFIQDGGAQAHHAALDHMARPLHRAAYQQARAVDDFAALGAMGLPEGSPQVACGRGACLAFYGMIVDEAFQEEMTRQGGAANALLARFHRSGLEGLSGQNGSYAIALWESQPQRLTLLHDRVGYASLYYWHGPRGLWFASEYKAIIQESSFERHIDSTAVADLFLYQFPAAGRTPFLGIRALPPAGLLTYQQGRLQVDTYGPALLRSRAPAGNTKSTDSKNQTSQDIEYADGLIFYLRQAIRRRVRPGTVLLITGGLDSRIVAGVYQSEAPDNGLTTSTVGLASGRDVVLGQRLSAALGFPHTSVPLGEDYLARYAAPLTWQAESKIGSYASWILAQAAGMRADDLQADRQRYAMSGLFGNLISGRSYSPEIIRANNLQEGAAAVESFTQPYLPGLKKIMHPAVFRQAAAESLSFLSDVYFTAPVENMLSRYDWMILQVRAACAGNTADALGDVAMALEPFLDNDLLDYALNDIPLAVRTRALFYYHLIVRHLPLVAAIPDGRSDFSIHTDLRLRQSAWLYWLENTRGRALRRLMPSRFSHEVRSSVPHAAAIRGGSRAFVQSVLSRVDHHADLFDPPAVRALLEDHLTGRQNAFMTLNSLLTTLLWLEQFCETSPPGPVFTQSLPAG